MWQGAAPVSSGLPESLAHSMRPAATPGSDHHAHLGPPPRAGFHDGSETNPVGGTPPSAPAKRLIPQRFFVVSLNNLGGCHGSTGPVAIQTRSPYGSDFPIVAVKGLGKKPGHAGRSAGAFSSGPPSWVETGPCRPCNGPSIFRHGYNAVIIAAT